MLNITRETFLNTRKRPFVFTVFLFLFFMKLTSLHHRHTENIFNDIHEIV